VVYYQLETQKGLVRRMLGNDKLRVRRRQGDTYWADLESEGDAARYERQF